MIDICKGCGQARTSASMRPDGYCNGCDATYEAGVEAAIAAMQTHDAIDVLAEHWGGRGDAMGALAQHVRRVVKR